MLVKTDKVHYITPTTLEPFSERTSRGGKTKHNSDKFDNEINGQSLNKIKLPFTFQFYYLN